MAAEQNTTDKRLDDFREDVNNQLDAIRADIRQIRNWMFAGRDCDCGDAVGDVAEHRSWIAAHRIGTRLDADARA